MPSGVPPSNLTAHTQECVRRGEVAPATLSVSRKHSSQPRPTQNRDRERGRGVGRQEQTEFKVAWPVLLPAPGRPSHHIGVINHSYTSPWGTLGAWKSIPMGTCYVMKYFLNVFKSIAIKKQWTYLLAVSVGIFLLITASLKCEAYAGVMKASASQL